MGSKTVILIGQDLAMTGNHTHADGTFKDKMDEIDINSGEYFEVESVDGGKVLTRDDLIDIGNGLKPIRKMGCDYAC